MDIKRDTSGAKKLRILYGAIGVLVIGGITLGLSRLDRAAPTVDRATLWMDTVKRGELLLERRGAGTLVPEEVRAITARTAGRIEERYVRNGEKGKEEKKRKKKGKGRKEKKKGKGGVVEWFFFSDRRRHTGLVSDWGSDVCSSDLGLRVQDYKASVVGH